MILAYEYIKSTGLSILVVTLAKIQTFPELMPE